MIHSHSWGPKQVSDEHSSVCKIITAHKSLASGVIEYVVLFNDCYELDTVVIGFMELLKRLKAGGAIN